jgi:signal transduction histidine kinase
METRLFPAESYCENATSEDGLRSVRILEKPASFDLEVADRQRAQKLLHDLRAKLSIAVDVAGLGMWELDFATNSAVLSAKCKSLLNLESWGILRYQQLFDAIHPDDRNAVKTAFETALATGESCRIECRVTQSDGSLRWLTMIGRPFPPRSLRMLGAVQDITAQKRAAEILEQTVAERTMELAQTVSELESFSYSISHDMRSPLRAMYCYAASLLEDYGPKLAPEAVLRLERIQRASRRLDLLVRDLLAYSKVSNGEIQLKPLILDDLLEDILQNHPEFEQFRDCISIQKPLHMVIGQEAFLTQCLTNLLANALKFVAPGTRPAVRIYSEQAGTSSVKVWVSDNGIGIQPEHYDRIFRMFGRVHADTTYDGTGIGLAIVKKAVQRMGGEIGFVSEAGRGTEFWFMLPGVCEHE